MFLIKWFKFQEQKRRFNLIVPLNMSDAMFNAIENGMFWEHEKYNNRILESSRFPEYKTSHLWRVLRNGNSFLIYNIKLRCHDKNGFKCN